MNEYVSQIDCPEAWPSQLRAPDYGSTEYLISLYVCFVHVCDELLN